MTHPILCERKASSPRLFSSLSFLFALWFWLGVPLHAGTRDSANYHVAADTLDDGGGRSASTVYRNIGSIGKIVGISAVAVPTEKAKNGFVGQLGEVSGLILSAPNDPVLVPG